MNVFIMQDSLIKPFGRDAQNALIGFVGENNSRTFFIRTRDDLTGYTVSLVIDETDCGAMTKTPMPDGSTMLTITLTSGMLGQGGNKTCQLIMANETTVKKSSQFFAFVGLANDITQAATDSATIIVISEAITQMISDSIPPDYSELLSDVDDLKSNLSNLDDRVEALESGGGGSGLTEGVKAALLQLAQKVAYIDDGGQDYYDDLYNALYPPADLVSISAVYTQSGTVYDTDTLDSLKSDLVVTALMSDSTTQTVTNYTLSGTLTEGTSTITVTYGGKTTSFNVTVTVLPDERVLLYNWDFTESLTDTVEGVAVTSATNREPTRDSTGLVFSEALQQVTVPISVDMSGKTIELDVASAEFNGSTSYHSRIIMLNDALASSNGCGLLLWRNNGALSAYGSTASTGTSRGWGSAWSSELSGTAAAMYTLLSGKTVKIVCDSDGHTMDIYLDGVQKGTINSIYFGNSQMRYLHLGGLRSQNQSDGNQCYNMTITGLRIYQNAAEGDGE